MAQAGYSTIQLYYTTTLSAAPVAGNLLPGELGFNINNADFALYAENASGTVTRLMNNPAGLKYPTADGTAGYAITTNGSGTLSFGMILPPQAGNAGKTLTTDGTTPSWAAINVASGTTLTGSVTLTNSSPAAMVVTPTGAGLYATLPDATTCAKGVSLYSIYNAGEYDYGVKNSAGTKLGWVRAKTGAIIGLADNSVAAGTWANYGLEKTGVTSLATLGVSATLTNFMVALDADRSMFFLTASAATYGVIYNSSTNTWGSATLIRTATNNLFGAVLIATDKVLFVSCALSSTAMESVVLSTSGTAITVNTPSGTTLSATCGGLNLTLVGTSGVVSYLIGGTAYGVRAITVSGTTPTVGAEASAAGTSYAGGILASFALSGSFILASPTSTSAFNITPFTISGSTATTGTAASVTWANTFSFRYFLAGSGNVVFGYCNSTYYCGIAKLTGSTITVSTLSVDSNNTSPGNTNTDFAAISSTKTLSLSNTSTSIDVNILTDSSGTISKGTAVNPTPGSSTTTTILSCNATTAVIATLSTYNGVVLTFDVTGSSPTLTNSVVVSPGNLSSDVTLIGGSGVNSARYPQKLIASGTYAFVTSDRATLWSANSALRTLQQLTPATPNCPGQSTSDSFGSSSMSNTQKTTVNRIEAAA